MCISVKCIYYVCLKRGYVNLGEVNIVFISEKVI
jgi:hypothetical protein